MWLAVVSRRQAPFVTGTGPTVPSWRMNVRASVRDVTAEGNQKCNRTRRTRCGVSWQTAVAGAEVAVPARRATHRGPLDSEGDAGKLRAVSPGAARGRPCRGVSCEVTNSGMVYRVGYSKEGQAEPIGLMDPRPARSVLHPTLSDSRPAGRAGRWLEG